ncbi:hypothetical protein [Pontibacter vulgaris]|uniref:hypothetical protein n=1 Tax=Pontibacter vulgaris TaxID=2905679 RepID=UPI001FA738F1|nr:hypothetical protein [Pontibacter vulgaris]
MLIANHNTAPDDARIEVAKNLCYEIYFSMGKNRAYLTLKGFWKSKQVVAGYLEDLKKLLVLTEPGFTILTDQSQLVTHPQELNDLHLEAQRLMVKEGVQQVAHIMPSDKIASLQVNAIADQTGLPISKFATIEEAETWLDNTVSFE